MRTFWMCCVKGSRDGARFAHYSLEEAERETERLARLPENKGRTVYLLECIGKCEVNLSPVVWEYPDGDEDEDEYEDDGGVAQQQWCHRVFMKDCDE